MARAVHWLLVAAVVLGLSQGPALVDAHGSLIQPRPRNTYFFNDPTARVYDTNAGNGLGPQPFRPVGQPGVCGDPFQGLSTNMAGTTYPISATYTSGQTVEFRVNLRVNHGGVYRFRLCNRRTNLDQACFNALPLVRADNGQREYYILTGRFDANVPVNEVAVLQYRLPAGFACPNGCTIQWEYMTYNSCIENCNRQFCSWYADKLNRIPGVNSGPLATCYTPGAPAPEIFYNCADVVIQGTSTPRPPPPSPLPGNRPPPPSPVPGPGTGTDPCPGTAPGQSRASCFCRNRAIGRYQDVFYGCQGGFWCYSGGSAYIQCQSGLRYNTLAGGVCDFAQNVACPNNVVAPASVGVTEVLRAVRPAPVVSTTMSGADDVAAAAAGVPADEVPAAAAASVPAEEVPAAAGVPAEEVSAAAASVPADEVAAAAAGVPADVAPAAADPMDVDPAAMAPAQVPLPEPVIVVADDVAGR